MSLIITSPHAACINNVSIRTCDLAASMAGQMFYQICEKYKIKSIYLEGNEFRYKHDLNRKTSRKTQFRKELQNLLLRENPKLLIDIHSFPNYRIEDAAVNFFENGEQPPDIVLLRSSLDIFQSNKTNKTNKRYSICNTLFNRLSQNCKCKILEGITVNDILNNCSELNIPGILIEINEKFTQDPKSLEPILNCIINEIKQII